MICITLLLNNYWKIVILTFRTLFVFAEEARKLSKYYHTVLLAWKHSPRKTGLIGFSNYKSIHVMSAYRLNLNVRDREIIYRGAFSLRL